MKSLGGTVAAPAGAAPRHVAAPHSLGASANGFFGVTSQGTSAPAAVLPSAPAAAPPVVLPASSEPPPPSRYSSLSAREHATWVQLEKQREGRPGSSIFGSSGSGLSALEEATWAALAKRVHKEQAEYAAWWWAHANAERPTRYGRIDHEVEIEVDHWLRARSERAISTSTCMQALTTTRPPPSSQGRARRRAVSPGVHQSHRHRHPGAP
jgi:hypothetical protein